MRFEEWRPRILAGLGDRRVRRWLMLLTAVVVGSLVANTLAMISAERRQSAAEQQLRAAEALSNQYDEVAIVMANFRHAEERLVAKPGEAALQEAVVGGQAAQSELKRFKSSDPQLTKRLQHLQRLLDADLVDLQAFISTSASLGMDESGGLRGEFRDRIRQVETDLYRWRAPDALLVDLGNIRRSELNYLTGGRLADASQAPGSVAILRADLDQGGFSSAAKASILADLSAYLAAFERYVAIRGQQQKLALRLEADGQAVTREIAKLDEESSASAKAAENAFTGGGALLRHVSLAMMFLLGGVSIVLAVVVVRDVAQTIEAMERSERVKSEFLAMISHELRTPLNAVLGFADLLAEQLGGPLSPFYLDCAQGVRSGGWRLLECVDDLLEVARLNAGGEDPALGPIDVASAIASATAAAQFEAARRGVVFTAELPEGLLATGEPRMAGLVVAKLLSNAVKFTPAGGGVRLEASQVGDEVQVRVSDTGPGIAPALLSRVMEPFVQGESGLNRSHEGRGLGLTIAKRLAAQQKGLLTLTSRLGEGVTATFSLPVVPEA